MKNILSYFLISLLTFGLVVSDASAKRFGGGRSFGVQRSHSALFSPKQHSTQSAFSPRTNTNRWGGVLGGMLIGGLLTSLFMGHGLASGMFSWLLVGFAVFFVMSLVRKKMHPAFQSNQNQSTTFNSVFNKPSQPATSTPPGFSESEFLRDAKTKFIRLQASFDQKNLQDLRDFTAPEVFAEIKMQLEERGDAFNQTEVLRLDAQLLDASQQAGSFMASVRFTGSVVEDNNPATPLDEIWHFRQFSPYGEWVVGGIQQCSPSLVD